MSTHARAFLIALFGPVVSATGLLWSAAHAYVFPDERLTLRLVVFDPAHLIIFVGILVSLVCIPVAFAVLRGSAEDVELVLFEPEGQENEQRNDVPGGTWEVAD